MSAEELHEFYQRIGAALWHLQHLEDVLVTFITVKIVTERRSAGIHVNASVAQNVLAEKRHKMTLGRLIDDCCKKNIIQDEHQPRFKAFKVERDWLVHRCVVESGDDLHLTATRHTLFKRIIAIKEEAISLKKIVVQTLDSWMIAHGVDPVAAEQQGLRKIRKLRGEKTEV